MAFGRTMEKCPILNFALKFDLMSTPLPKKDLINQIGELTSGQGTEKYSIIIFVFAMCQPRPSTSWSAAYWRVDIRADHREMSNNYFAKLSFCYVLNPPTRRQQIGDMTSGRTKENVQ